MPVATRSPLRILYVGSLIAGVAVTTVWAGAGCANLAAGSGATGGNGPSGSGAGGNVDCSDCGQDAPDTQGFAAPVPPTNNSTAASSSSGPGTPASCPPEPQGPNVTKAPDNTRTYDSAV